MRVSPPLCAPYKNRKTHICTSLAEIETATVGQMQNGMSVRVNVVGNVAVLLGLFYNEAMP
jgi:hypothetical protein